MLTFPELHRESTLEWPVIGASSAVVAGLLVPVSWKLAAVAFAPCGLWLAHAAWVAILNARLRYRWACRFPQRLTFRQLRNELESSPQRFVAHVRYYGGFDAVALCPAVVVEDRETGGLTAVYPSSWNVIGLCDRLGVPIATE